MLIRIFDVLDRDRKIQCIKHLRDATGLGLRESKDHVDELFRGRSSAGIEVYVRDDYTARDFKAFSAWFEYENGEPLDDGSAPKGTLQLFRVILSAEKHVFMSVVLSTSKPHARAAAVEDIQTNYSFVIGADATSTIEEVTSFKNGQVLLTSRV